MGLEPTLLDQELLADTFRRADARMPTSERLSETTIAAAFVIAVAALWIAQPPGGIRLVPAVLCLAVLAVATRVRFDTPFGYTVATQLAFVPLLFAVPVTIVPVAVVLGLALASAPDIIAGRLRPGRTLLAIGNSWFAIGPVAVFVVANTQPQAAGAGLLIVALIAQFLGDFCVSTLRFWIDRDAGFGAQLRELWVYGIDAALSGMALVVAEDVRAHPIAALAPLPILGLLAVFARERHSRIESLLELNTAYRGTALVLGDVVRADDGYTGEHSQGVVQLAVKLGEAIGLDDERLRNLEFAALLHDVGKIAIPKEIINNPGKLDPDEWVLIRTHTIEGQRMLDQIGGFMHNVGLAVRSHHERWDGGGYPDGLAGKNIPLESRLIACCDSWNAMRTDRSYRRALSHEVAVAEMRANAGTQFDPHLVELLLELVGRTGAASSDPAALAEPASAHH